MTPQDILNKKFDKGMGGYKVEDVNAFLIEVGDYMQDLIDANADLEHKLVVLAEKLEEYRADEDSLRAALIGAQKLGDSVVRESKKKAEALLQGAQAQAEEILAGARSNIDKEAQTLTRMQAEVGKFRQQILDQYQKQIQLIKTLPQTPEMPVVQAAPVQQPVYAPVAQEENEPEQQEEPEVFTIHFDEEDLGGGALEEPAPAGRKKSKFGKLQFGEGFDLTRDE